MENKGPCFFGVFMYWLFKGCIRWFKILGNGKVVGQCSVHIQILLFPINIRFRRPPSSIQDWNLGSFIIFSCHVSLGPSWLWQFLRLTLFLIILTVLRSIGQELCGLLLRRDLSGAFSHSWTGITRSGRTTAEIKLLSSHHSKGTSYQHDLSLLMLTLTTWLRFLQYQVTLLSPFHTALFGRKSLCTARI